ncbi:MULTISPECIES: hypothetical protein [unclassified Sulfitobacter]|jgi:hypothetical protein|nr:MULTISPECIES: hypothetical protein [unclassified Sulfitobacter]KZX97742.1 hypothetical protein A3720_17635 [Sulfitobacter sp. HI0021]KZY04579.1 hypothetical protein A3722_18800 [Sulfitobacter sp. HI0027]KZZ01844.1 hypothetical protein A3747_17815 [Sulfitobacter sp. HI0076]
MPEGIQALLALPIDTLALLAGGYLAYRLAYTGRDKTHSTIDMLFIATTFAFVTSAGRLIAATYLTGPIVLNLAGIAVALLAAAGWRRFGSKWTHKALRVTRISLSDRETTAWDSMLIQEHHTAAAILVKKTDGSMLFCDDLHAFKDDPHGPCVLGADGSVAMYVTSSQPSSGADWVDHELRTEDGAAVITYIPAQNISEIRVWKNR